jgi:HEAT repeat protein
MEASVSTGRSFQLAIFLLLVGANPVRAEGDPVPMLVEKLAQSDSFRVRTQAAAVLGRIRDPRAIDPLIASLSHDESYVVRGASAGALGHLGGARVIDPLFRALRDEDPFVRSLAEEALTEVKGDDVALYYRAHLFGGAYRAERPIALKNLTRLCLAGDAVAASVMAEALTSTELRADAASALEKCPEAQSVPVLIAALDAEDTQARLVAAQVLARKPSARVVTALGAAYGETAQDEPVREQLRVGLKSMRSLVDLADLIEEATSTEQNERRTQAIRLLGVYNEPSAIVALIYPGSVGARAGRCRRQRGATEA